MKTNLGGLDKIIRVSLAVVAGLLVYFEVVDDTLAYILLTLIGVFVITSLVGFCPLYGIFGINSCGRKKN